MSDLKEHVHDVTEATATARLPNVDIEIIHRRSPQGDSEQFLISMQAVPSFEAFGRFLEGANPFAFWAEAAKLAWMSWIDVAQLAMLPLSVGASLPPPRSRQRSTAQPRF